MNWGRGHFRPMPKDFREHAEESIPLLIRRYRSSQATVTRWKELCGTQRPRERAVIRIDWEGNEKFFPSISAAARGTRYGNASNICQAVRRGKMSAGYEWRYADDCDLL